MYKFSLILAAFLKHRCIFFAHFPAAELIYIFPHHWYQSSEHIQRQTMCNALTNSSFFIRLKAFWWYLRCIFLKKCSKSAFRSTFSPICCISHPNPAILVSHYAPFLRSHENYSSQHKLSDKRSRARNSTTLYCVYTIDHAPYTI